MTDLRTLGDGLPPVSPLTLGGNSLGWGADEDASFQVLDAYVAGGGNHIDTANNYSAWVPGHHGGESERVIGRWLASGRRRDEVVIASKVGMAIGEVGGGLTRDFILREAEGSLERLQTDRIDLYYAHEDDPATPLAETLGAFAELLDQGMVGAVAASNYPAARLAEARELAEREGLPRFVAYQGHYNLIERDAYEGAVEAETAGRGLGTLSYYSLARGFLTGKYRPGRPLPDSPRVPGVTGSYLNERGEAVLAAVDAVASETGASPAQVSLAWLLNRVTSAIASATRPDQVAELLGAAEVELTPDQVERLTASAA
ncbi:MAG: aldo/keto reductase [Thermoleophilia bacterium]